MNAPQLHHLSANMGSAGAAPAQSEGGLSGSYVRMSAERAQLILLSNYGLSGKLTRFDTEKDDTFKVCTETGNFVLKVANPNEPREEIEFQNGILAHVAAKDPYLPVPRIIRNYEDSEIFTIQDKDGSLRYVRLLTFLEGTLLDCTQSSAGERIKIGKMLARLRHATEGFSHPGEKRRYPWDVQHLLQHESLLKEVDDPANRRTLAQGIERFRAVEPRLRACRQQVLHNDFSKSNIVVDHDDTAFVKGIIDFGDAVKTAIAIDVATAILNQLPEEPHDDLFFRGRDILAGYLHITELTDEELALIPHLVMARVVVRALLTLWRVKLFPENHAYIMRNTKQGWHQLDWFLARSPDEISEILLPFAGQRGL